ncbi:replication protein P [Gynuella sunshinyii]|nr:replication protein P [Gynuella sunshinyii]
MKSDEKSWISTTPTGNQPQGLDEQTKILVNMVFARLRASYGHRFDSTFGDGDSLNIAKREWGFCLQGYSEAQLASALHAAKLKYAWPPAISEFLELMQTNPEDLGLPSARDAYQEACSCRIDPRRFPWRHAIVYEAAKRTEFWRLKTAPEKESWPLFEKNYKELVKKVLDGEDFTVPDSIRLEDNSSVTVALDIEQLAEQNGIDSSLLYYMQKPKHSPIRQQLRQRALKKLSELGIDLVLPD